MIIQPTFFRCAPSSIRWDKTSSTPIPARNILIIQDGTSRPAYWDGTTSGTLNPQVNVVVDGSGNTTYPADYNQTRAGQRWLQSIDLLGQPSGVFGSRHANVHLHACRGRHRV